MVIDAWEHAYYLQYKTKKTDYFTALWNLWDWNDVRQRLARASEVDLALEGTKRRNANGASATSVVANIMLVPTSSLKIAGWDMNDTNSTATVNASLGTGTSTLLAGNTATREFNLASLPVANNTPSLLPTPPMAPPELPGTNNKGYVMNRINPQSSALQKLPGLQTTSKLFRTNTNNSSANAASL